MHGLLKTKPALDMLLFDGFDKNVKKVEEFMAFNVNGQNERDCEEEETWYRDSCNAQCRERTEVEDCDLELYVFLQGLKEGDSGIGGGVARAMIPKEKETQEIPQLDIGFANLWVSAITMVHRGER